VTYYRTFMAFETCLRPCDLGDLTPQMMDALFDYAEAKFGG